MGRGLVQIIGGDGRGKTTAALGQALKAAGAGKRVVMIQFLKGRRFEELEFYKRLEPEIKIFRFEKLDVFYEKLTQEQKQEEMQNIKNGLNFAKKVLVTGECDLLILDEILGLLDNGIIRMDDLKIIIQAKPEEAELVLTGITLNSEICDLADEVSKIEKLKSAVPSGNQTEGESRH